MKIAVVVPIKNEVDGLQELVDALLGQSLQPDEIIFVDAGSTDGSVELLHSLYGDNSRVRVINSPGAFCGQGRNVAIRNTNASIIAQIDGGNKPDSRWLELLCVPIIKGEAEYVIGGLRFMPIPKKILGIEFNIAEIYGTSIFPKRREEEYEEGYICGGAGIAYKRDVWERVGGIPDVKVAEDVLFVKKVLRLNMIKIVFVGDTWIYWQIGPSLADIIRRQIDYQTAKFRESENIFRFKGTVILPPLVVILAVLSVWFPWVLYVIPVVISGYWLRKTFKALKINKRRSPEMFSGIKGVIVLSAISIVELIHVISRIIGMVRGILRFRDRERFLKIRNNYLNKDDANQ